MTTATRTPPVHRCALCHTRLPAQQWIYSRHTGNRFCLDYRACERRAKRRNGKDS